MRRFKSRTVAQDKNWVTMYEQKERTFEPIWRRTWYVPKSMIQTLFPISTIDWPIGKLYACIARDTGKNAHTGRRHGFQRNIDARKWDLVRRVFLIHLWFPDLYSASLTMTIKRHILVHWHSLLVYLPCTFLVRHVVHLEILLRIEHHLAKYTVCKRKQRIVSLWPSSVVSFFQQICGIWFNSGNCTQQY